MKKILKIVVAAVAILLLVLLSAPMLLREKIAGVVKREANAVLVATLDFESLRVNFLRHFPRASLELRGMTLVGEGRFAGDTIAAVERLSVVVNPLSLFGNGGFEVSKVILAGPVLHAHRPDTFNLPGLLPGPAAARFSRRLPGGAAVLRHAAAGLPFGLAGRFPARVLAEPGGRRRGRAAGCAGRVRAV